MLEDSELATDLLLGRDFLNFHNITATFKPFNKVASDKIESPSIGDDQDFAHALLQIPICDAVNAPDSPYEDLRTVF